MIEVGVLGLDTSHPESFADIISETKDATVSAVWDSGDVREESYTRSFCNEYEAHRYDNPAAMVDEVDAAMVLTVDWETHVPLAERFLEAGVPTLVDKPLAGHKAAVNRLEAAAAAAPLFGGSAVPFHPSFERLPRNGDQRTLFAAGYNDYFYYRVHLSDTARLLADAPWEVVEPTSSRGTTVRVLFADETQAMLRYDGGPENNAFGVLDVADRTRTAEVLSGEDAFEELYDPYVGAFLDTVRGQRDDTDRVLDSGTLALAVEAALEDESRVTRDSKTLTELYVEAEPFIADYSPYY